MRLVKEKQLLMRRDLSRGLSVKEYKMLQCGVFVPHCVDKVYFLLRYS